MTTPDTIAIPPRSRVRVALGAVVVLGLVGVAVTISVGAFGPSGVTRSVVPSPASSTPARNMSVAPLPTIYVHLTGAVNRPGLFPLAEGSRAIDAVAAAGGFTPAADQTQLNLARLLSDGEQIIVPELGATPTPAAGGQPPQLGGKINLNSADETTLDTLPGIGPATAKSIIKWREDNGRFSSIEDLMSIGGIGDKTFATLKDLVTV